MHNNKLQLNFIKNCLRKLPAKYCFGRSCLGTLFPCSHVYARLAVGLVKYIHRPQMDDLPKNYITKCFLKISEVSIVN